MRTRSKAVLACWLVFAVFVAGICLVLGGIDDAPGLGGLGLLAALAMILAAASRWGVMARGTAVALFTGICGLLALAGPLVLWADGEIAGPGPGIPVMLAGALVLMLAVRRLRR